MSVQPGRPGSDPQRPHQDLRIPSRIPSQYLSQVLPSSSSSSSSFNTPPVAVQIASLHRAAEVARFEWRAAQRCRPSASHDDHPVSHAPTSHRRSQSRQTSSQQQQQQQQQPRRVRRPSRQYTGNSSSISLSTAQARDSSVASRVFASASEAYVSALQDLGRRTGAGMIDISDAEAEDANEDVGEASETSTDSTNTEEEVIASTMASRTVPGRRAERGNAPASSTSPSSFGGLGLSRDSNIIAESQVWDRMVNDLAIGAGVAGAPQGQRSDSLHGEFSHQQGISGGIAASMLALSAAIPRSDARMSSSSSRNTVQPRSLPHPIWARRYPGAAGEWLRGELSRRANGSSSQAQASHGSTNIPRPAAAHASPRRWRGTIPSQWDDRSSPALQTTQVHSSSPPPTNPFNDLFSDRQSTRNDSDWNVLRFPALDPARRERGRSTSDQPSSEVLQGSNTSTSLAIPSANTLTVPVSNRAQDPTPPLPEMIDSRGDADRTAGATGERSRPVNQDAADLVAQMARASRTGAAGHNARLGATADEGQSARSSESVRTSRAVRGGMSYIQRLRHLDGLDTPATPQPVAEVDNEAAEAGIEPQPYEVFPWYHPPRVNNGRSYLSRGNEDDGEKEGEFDPDGSNLSWYDLARERMAAMHSPQAVSEGFDDPDGERVDFAGAEDGRQIMGVRRRVLTGSSVTATQRARNRSALVMADASRNESTLGHQSSAREEFQDPADAWTLVDQRPMSPIRRSRDEGSESVTTWLREPANPTSRLSSSPLPMNDSDSIVRLPTTRTVHTYRPIPVSDDPRTTRRPRRLASLADEDIEQYSLFSTGFDGLGGREAREDTPSPELHPSETSPDQARWNARDESEVVNRARRLTSIGRRLEEEFRERQSELRQREERLRDEVARRRLELDEVRRRHGRIGRVVDSSSERQNDQGRDSTAREMASPTEAGAQIASEVMPLLAEQETTLIRRRALREPRRAVSASSHDVQSSLLSTARERVAAAEEEGEAIRAPPLTPLEEIMSRLSLHSTQTRTQACQTLRRALSVSSLPSATVLLPLPFSSLDDHFLTG